jgi:F-type H+-transporting ATPase subunit delta
MSSNLIANRYAKALMKLTEGQPALSEKALGFLQACSELFEMPEAKMVLKSPVMPSDLKKAVLNFVAQKTDSAKDLGGFADQVVDAGRTTLLPEIFKAYKHMLDEKRGVAEATVITAEPISDAIKKELVGALEKIFQKKITVQSEIDKDVLGGVVVRVGNYTIDLSLKNRLNSVAEFAQR